MKSLLLTFIFLATLIFVSSQAPPESDDTDCNFTAKGDRWRESCNWCHCTENGKKICTRRGCPPALEKRLQEEKECEGGAHWKKDCNWCSCVPSGKAICTAAFCGTFPQTPEIKIELIPQERALPEGAKCEDLSGDGSWKDKCNTCHCGNGHPVCTKIFCRPDFTPDPSEAQCSGQVRWMNDCNLCNCVDGKAICTEKLCRTEEKEPEPDCKFTAEGDMWRKSCNWCRCSEKGKGFCTRRGCPPELEIRLQNENECEGNAQWKNDCNWCSCHNGKAACTEMACGLSPETPKSTAAISSSSAGKSLKREANCEDSSGDGSWKVECNWCKCGNGASLCTRRFCGANFEEKSVSSPECNGKVRWKKDCNWCECVEGVAVCSAENCVQDATSEGEEHICKSSNNEGRWRKECNWCRCRNGLGMCTKKGCRPTEVSRDSAVCEGDITWKEGTCNWCRCVEGKAVCGTQFCGNEVNSREERKEDGKATCSDGQSWISECNTCSCINGIPFCTLKACTNELSNDLMIDILKKRAVEISDESSIVKNQVTFNCKEGSRWKKACNWCTCTNNTGICTLRGCLTSEELPPLCEEGSQWKDNCNFCSCSRGIPVCSKMLCKHKSPSFGIGTGIQAAVRNIAVIPTKRQREPDCEVGSRWRKLCNWCTCTETGYGICEQKACLSDSDAELDGTCEGTSRWRENCNWCNCANGRGVCTAMACVSADDPIDVPIREPEEKMCEDGSRWGSGCNWCNCINGTGSCTLKACLPGNEQSLEGKCEGNSKWKKECNWCHCVNGNGICTQKACVGHHITTQVSADETSCINGSSWTNECNVCVCVGDSTVCTKRACQPAKTRQDQCTEGETWKDNCNNCRCINGEGACTRKICKPPMDAIPELCSLPPIRPDAVVRSGFVKMMWTYNKETASCDEVIYGGGGGTENLFDTEHDCVTTCSTPSPNLRSIAVKEETNPRERCYLPKDGGNCFALFHRYAFNPETKSCERFVYGGCHGNQNNFMSEAECYKTCGGAPPSLDMNCDRSKCDWKRHAHYIAKECDPIYEGGSCCPTSFSCKSEQERGKDPSKCYYKGKEYQAKEPVPVTDVCSKGCRCDSSLPGRGVAEIRCANVECPSSFRPIDPGCRSIFEEGKCCEVDKICEDPNAPPVAETRSIQCHWNNKTWDSGDKMFFDDLPCRKCICTDKFTNPNGPGCDRIDCGFEFRYRKRFVDGCTPIYFEEKCCPVDWICPDDSRLSQVQSDTEASTGMHSGQCLLGNLVVPLGGSVNVTDCKIKCDCVTPPDLTCVRYRSCDLAQEILSTRDSSFECPQKNCPAECSLSIDARTGCQECTCGNHINYTCPEPSCPPECHNPTIEFSEPIGCRICKCECQKTYRGKPECPMDCAVKYIFDKQSDCNICICNPDNPSNPFYFNVI